MAGAQNLTTNIVINAKTGNGFGRAGALLTEMGQIVNGLSQQLISFGTDSVRVYRDYEKSMREAEVALSTVYGRGSELRRVMTELDSAATDWAASTVFHTDDVSNAIAEAAHAGWDLEQIMSGIPEAMELAQAGSLDLSEALDYIIKATYAAGVGFDELNGFTDVWTLAANSSATTIGEMGEAMLKMGSTMRFSSSTEELMTLIAATANAGAVGSEAGTMIRNSIMRLVAPSDKASKALSQLGASSTEMAEVLGDEELGAAVETLSKNGFQGVYDNAGRLRSILDIYSDLARTLGGMAGGIDKIASSEEAMAILGKIFPTRTITEALNLMNAAANNYDGLYDTLMSGAAEGYGAYAASTMMDTLNGRIETFNSKVERLKQLTGAELKPVVEGAAAIGGEFIDRLANMEPEKFSALVSSLTAVAATGPALLTAGAALRLIGLAMTPVGAGALAITGAAAGIAYLVDLSNTRYEGQFGTMALDAGALEAHIQGIGEELRSAYAEADRLHEAAVSAAESYQSAASALSEGLLTAMLTDKKLSASDRDALSKLVGQMDSALRETITKSHAASDSYWSTLLGDGDSELLSWVLEQTGSAAEKAMAEAEQLSAQLRGAMTSAFADGEVSDEEYQQILAYMRDYNAAVARAEAEIQSEQDYVQRQKWLRQGQTASEDEITAIAQEAAEQRETRLGEAEERYLDEMFKLQYENGGVLPEEKQTKLDTAFAAEKARITSEYDAFLLDLYGSARDSNELDGGAVMRSYAEQVEMLGGAEGMRQAAAGYAESGDTEAAKKLDEVMQVAEEQQFTESGFRLYNPNTWFNGYSTRAMDERLIDGMGAAMYGTSYIPAAQQEAQVEAAQRFLFGTGEPLSARTFDAESMAALRVPLEADDDAVRGTLQELSGTPVPITLVPKLGGLLSGLLGPVGLFAEGGRATEASVFGEAGAEWAIPEEHSRRTAELLDAARAASGFTWPELLQSVGGFSADAGHTPTTVVYSPTIHAQDSRGVEAALREDKKRLERWWEDRAFRERAVRYQ